MSNGTPHEKPARYYLSLLGGLEDVVAGELAQRVPEAEVVGRRPGRLFVEYGGGPKPLTDLRSIENVFAYVAQFDGLSCRRDGLQEVENHLGEVDLGPATQLRQQLHGPVAGPVFRVTGTRSGEHEYKSQEIAAAAGSAIQAAYGWDVDLKNFNFEVNVEVEDDHCLVGLRLTPEALHKRSRVVHGIASLNPTAAYAMCVLSGPEADEVVLDPMCGTGTILIERAALGPARLIGSDAFGEAMREVCMNLNATGVTAHLVQADARRLPFASAGIDKVLCNLPWGRRVLSYRTIRRLYKRFVPELERVMRPGGKAVLLTTQWGLMVSLVHRAPSLAITHDRIIRIGGMKPHLYILQKED